jgi:hypothetical protein
MNVEARQKRVAQKRADDANRGVTDQAKAISANDLSRKESGDPADE